MPLLKQKNISQLLERIDQQNTKIKYPICKVVKISYFTLGSSDINKAYRCVGNTRTKSPGFDFRKCKETNKQT
jgi:hypothetical protein